MAAHWDNIYESYKNGGQAWATLAEDLHPHFIRFVEETSFPKKCALDIGCGDGRYLKYLCDHGFTVIGLDESKTALSIARTLTPEAELIQADMNQWNIPADTYDCIVSVSTIQHGYKPDVERIVKKIHAALKEGGYIFITLPEWDSRKGWIEKGTHELLAPGVMAPLTGPEKGLAHCFYTETELRELFSDFNHIRLELDAYTRWVIIAAK